MPFCPNPDCPHRTSLGEPAEFNKGVTTCSDCGAILSAAAPTFEPLKKISKEAVGWKCPECGEVNPGDLAKCACGYDANRPFITTSTRDANEKARPAIQASKRVESYASIIKRAVIFSIVNFLAANFLFSLLPFSLGSVLLNVGRILITFYAGWLVIKYNVGELWKSAVTGPIVYCIDHIILKGGMFLVMYLLDPKGQSLLAFLGVLVSYVMFLPIFLAVGLLGGLFARSRGKKLTTDAT